MDPRLGGLAVDGFKTIGPVHDSRHELQWMMTWSPNDREGSFPHYGFDVDVYSLIPDAVPASSGLTQVVTQIFAPLMPFIQQQGRHGPPCSARSDFRPDDERAVPI